MCTVTYLPIDKGYILTSNRDEWDIRPKAIYPITYDLFGQKLTFPKDPKANGTWIAYSIGFTLCLLNGAFEKHIPKPPYKKSRGLVLLDFYQYQSVDKFISEYNFNGLENFTLLIKSNSDDKFDEIRWDGKTVYRQLLNHDEKYIWSSCTLYSEKIMLQRKIWFENWLKLNKTYNQEQLIDFHRFSGNGDIENNITMKRDNGVQTFSITSILKIGNILSNKYIEI